MSSAPQPESGFAPRTADWLARWPGVGLAFLWGFAEGTLFFILPDVLLSWVAMFRPRRALVHVAAMVLGAMLAGGVMFTWSAHSPQARQVVARVPAVSATMFIQAESDLQRHGVWGACAGPLRGIPYKVYAVEAPAHSMLWVFLAVTIPARLWRFVVVWLGFAGAGVLLRKFGRSSFAPSLHLLFWVVTYAIYWATV